MIDQTEVQQCKFFVPGRPIPGDTSNERHHWIATVTKVTAAVMADMTGRRPVFPKDTAVMCHLEFVMPRKQKMPKKKPTPDHTVRPAVDTLARPVMVALTNSGIWADDGQANGGYRSKRYAQPGELPGVHISLSTWQGDPST